MSGTLLRRATVRPGVEVDLLIVEGRIDAGPPAVATEVVDLNGRPVVAGLVDHHVHLLALAASWASVDLTPTALARAGGLDVALRAARARKPGGWLRGVGYDVAASGALNCLALDAVDVGPVRVQDRTGIQWILDRRGLNEVLPANRSDDPAGIEHDGAGRPTGVLIRLDRWLRDRLPPASPDLAAVGTWLAGRGVTSVTDAGADNGPAELALLDEAALPQRVVAMTGSVDVAPPDTAELGPVKVLLDDHDLPDLDELVLRVRRAHQRGRGVAVHCVTDAQVALALAAGIDHRDRIEHGTYVPADLLDAIVMAGPTIVTQPGLVATRGDRYLEDHEPDQRPALHRLRSFCEAGLRVAASSDGPYGPADPWTAVTAAVDRQTESGQVLGADEAVSVRRALDLFSGDPHNPGTPRPVEIGAPADLVVLDDDWDRVARKPAILATLRAGAVIAGRLPA